MKRINTVLKVFLFLFFGISLTNNVIGQCTSPDFTGTTTTLNISCGGMATLDGVATSTLIIDEPPTVTITPVALPDGAGMSFDVPLDYTGLFPAGAVVDATCPPVLSVDLEHDYANDLTIDLIAPDGMTVRIMDRANSGSHFGTCVNTADDAVPGCTATYTFDDAAATSIVGVATIGAPLANGDCSYTGGCDGSAYIPAGTYATANSIATTLAGSPLNGVWTIRVTDNAGSDDGSIDGAALTFPGSCYAPLMADNPDVNTDGTTFWAADAGNPEAITLPAQTNTATPYTDTNPLCGNITPADGCEGNVITNSVTVGPFNTEGTYTFTFTTEDANGCQFQQTSTVIVAACPMCDNPPDFTGTSTTININSGDMATLDGVAMSQQVIEEPPTVTIAPVALPDGAGMSFDVPLDYTGLFPAGAVVDATCSPVLSVDLEHDYANDLTIDLIAPDGMTVRIMDRANSGSHFGTCVNTADDAVPGCTATYTFDDAAATSIVGVATIGAPLANGDCSYTGGCDGSAYIPAGTYATANSIATTLAGSPLNGVWTIRVTDNAGSDDGSIDGASLNFPGSCYAGLMGDNPDINTDGTTFWAADAGNPAVITLPAQTNTGVPYTDTDPACGNIVPADGCDGNTVTNSVTVGPFTTPGTYTFTFTTEDVNGCQYQQTSTVIVTASPPTINIADPCDCANGLDLDTDNQNEYAQEIITVMPGTAPYTVTAVTGLFDATGTALTPAAATALLTGPDGSGNYTITGYVPADNTAVYSLSVEDAAAQTATINGGPCAPCPAGCNANNGTLMIGG